MRIILSDEGFKKAGYYYYPQRQMFRINPRKPIPLSLFRELRDNNGAVLVGHSMEEMLKMLKAKPGEKGIVQGMSSLDYGKRVGLSRQAVNQKIKAGLIKASRFGKVWWVTEEVEDEEKLVRQAGGEVVS